MYEISAGGDNARGIQRRSGWLLAMGSIHIVESGAGELREEMSSFAVRGRRAGRRAMETERSAA
jgi:hypothetical protein